MAGTNGRRRDETLRVTPAELDCTLGDIDANAARVRETLREARGDASDLVVFPELTLTGYSLGLVDADLARAADDDDITGELGFSGGSHVYDPWGELVAEAPVDEPALVTATLDLGAVRRRRREMPLVKEARLAVLSRELDRLTTEGGDL